MLLSSVSDIEKIFVKIFPENFNLDDSGISLSTFSARSYLKLHNITVSPNIVKTGITDIDPLRPGCGPDCTKMVILQNCEPELSYILVDLFNMGQKESGCPCVYKC